MRYLTAEEILAIHERLIEETGGLNGLRDPGLLFSIAERPKTTLMGIEMFIGLETKAAVYMESIATYHVFTDANKRTALTVASVFLRANGYEISVPETAGLRYVLAVAQKKKKIGEIAAWLKKYSKKVK